MGVKLESLLELRRTGKLQKQQDKIMVHLLYSGAEGLTRREIARQLSMEPCAVSARINELVYLGHLEDVGSRICGITGKRVGVVDVSGALLGIFIPEDSE